MTLSAPEDAAFAELYLWGPAGRSVAPTETGQSVTALRTALTELAANARSRRIDHPCDARFGREVGRVLADAQRQISEHSLRLCPRRIVSTRYVHCLNGRGDAAGTRAAQTEEDLAANRPFYGPTRPCGE